MEARGLTVREPYASYLVYGNKQYETRSRPTSYRGPVVIHAGKEMWGLRLPKPPHLGCAIGIGELTDCVPMTEDFLRDISKEEKAQGFWSVGRYAWKIENIRPIDPIPMRGQLGLWKIEI